MYMKLRQSVSVASFHEIYTNVYFHKNLHQSLFIKIKTSVASFHEMYKNLYFHKKLASQCKELIKWNSTVKLG